MDSTKLIVLGLYVSVLLLIGLYASKRIKSMSDFYIGGKRLGYWVVSFSARATGESGWLLIGLTGMGAISGLSAYWVVLGEVLGVAISWWYMAKRFKRRTDEYNSMTVPDYLESHFRSKTKTIRVLSASVLAVFSIIFISSQIDVTGKAFESMMNMNYYTGVFLGFGIVLSYIFIGGFVAAVWSDFFQGLLMFIGLVFLPIFVWVNMGGGELNVYQELNSIDSSLVNIWGTSDDFYMNLSTMIGFSMIGLGFLGAPHVYVRFMSIRNEKEIDKGKWIAVLFTLITDAAAVTIGILGRIYFTQNGEDPASILGIGGENVLAMLTENFLPAILIAIYMAVVLSAIMSTIDSLLVIASSAITRDFYQKLIRPDLKDKELGKLSKRVTLIMALISLGIALIISILSPERTVFWLIIFGWSGIAASFCPVIILSLFWKGLTEIGAIAAMVVGFLCVPVFKFLVPQIDYIGPYFEKMDVLGPSFLCSMLSAFIISKISQTKKAS